MDIYEGYSAPDSSIIVFRFAGTRAINNGNEKHLPILIITGTRHHVLVYVINSCPAKFHGNPAFDSTLVEIAFDSGRPAKQYWYPSADLQSLMAPNSAQLVRQIAQAESVRYTFTPILEATPEITTFNVHGLRADFLDRLRYKYEWIE
jgi:hypothetical protein